MMMNNNGLKIRLCDVVPQPSLYECGLTPYAPHTMRDTPTPRSWDERGGVAPKTSARWKASMPPLFRPHNFGLGFFSDLKPLFGCFSEHCSGLADTSRWLVGMFGGLCSFGGGIFWWFGLLILLGFFWRMMGYE